MPHEADSPAVRRRRLSNESRRSGPGKEDLSRKRKRRILSCDTCRRQKCRCELDEESETCARCRSLRITCTWNDSGDTHSASSRETPSKPDIEGRFRSLEASIVDLKATIQMLASGSRPDVRRTLATDRQERPHQPRPHPAHADQDSNEGCDASKAPGKEDVEPADRHVYSSPAEVVRKVGNQLSGGYRRTFDVQADVVSLGLLDDKTARDLVAEFVRRRRNTLLINSEVDLAPKNRDLRHASPFLHDVCCLHAMRFSEHSSSVLHRRVFEHVRLQMGQLMVASPLPLEELMGILIMSLWASAPSDFGAVSAGWADTTVAGSRIHRQLVGQRALRTASNAEHQFLGNTIENQIQDVDGRGSEGHEALVQYLPEKPPNKLRSYLHWAATTSRPATVPAAYLQQCKLLLNFEEVTMRDAMVYAEIMLYLLLQDKFSQRLYLSGDGTCEELSAWKTRWNYLFELPAASTLRISYSIAWLILARRSLEHDQAAPDHDSLSSSPRLHPVDAAANNGAHSQPSSQGPPDVTQFRVSAFATDVVRAFVDMPTSRAEELPEFHRLCVAYAMLIISKYEQKPSLTMGGSPSGQDDVVLQLLRDAQKHNGVKGNSAPSAIQFGLERALKKVSSRVEGRSSRAGADVGSEALGGNNGSLGAELSLSGAAVAAGPTWAQTTQDQQGDTPGQQHEHPSSHFTGATLVPEFDGSLSLETMDFFFSGGHLGLGDQSFF
ncbi:C6 zinc finger domain protein [Colletotrichum higginsianum IMI 349063]|uniref:Transcriptional activator of proteases prtT n=1 Tax=Colletotrichum higginsianum (strain IMI 349063) TaxID=759273 RepID=A0A1B7XZ95_COLHI|nr:C6 zinc finger domain protein [Colletotrichum higginsianum IMI 349063]OBR05072.1 C6 zinc finger domain protein [Colletotrichum higginsianum IMI 349063]